MKSGSSEAARALYWNELRTRHGASISRLLTQRQVYVNDVDFIARLCAHPFVSFKLHNLQLMLCMNYWQEDH